MEKRKKQELGLGQLGMGSLLIRVSKKVLSLERNQLPISFWWLGPNPSFRTCETLLVGMDFAYLHAHELVCHDLDVC